MTISVHPGIVTFILLTLPTLIRLITDYLRIEVKHHTFTTTTYLQRNIYTGLVMILCSLLNYAIFHNPNGAGPYAPYLTQVAASIGTFVMLFDYSLNLLRGKPIFYVSTNADHPSLWERLYQISPWYGTLLMKLVLCSAGWTSYICFEML